MDKQEIDKKLNKIKNFVLIKSGFEPNNIEIHIESDQVNGLVDMVHIVIDLKVQTSPDLETIGKTLLKIGKRFNSIFDTWGFDENLNFNLNGLKDRVSELVSTVTYSLDDETFRINFGYLIYLD